MFRDDRDALSARAEALEHQLKEAQKELRETRAELQEAEEELKKVQEHKAKPPKTNIPPEKSEPPAEPKQSRLERFREISGYATTDFKRATHKGRGFWIKMLLAVSPIILLGVAGIYQHLATPQKQYLTLEWDTRVAEIQGLSLTVGAPCLLVLDLVYRADLDYEYPSSDHNKYLELDGWRLTCGTHAEVVSSEKVTKFDIFRFTEEPAAEGTYRYHAKTLPKIESDSGVDFSIDTKEKTAKLYKDGQNFVVLTLTGPSTPHHGPSLVQTP